MCLYTGNVKLLENGVHDNFADGSNQHKPQKNNRAVSICNLQLANRFDASRLSIVFARTALEIKSIFHIKYSKNISRDLDFYVLFEKNV